MDKKEFEKMKSEYYDLRGWNVESGFPTKERVEELDLADIADELQERYPK